MNPQQAHEAANYSSLIAAVAGLVLGVTVGAFSKRPIPVWQIITFAAVIAVGSGLGLPDHAGWIRVVVGSMALGIFLSRKPQSGG